MRRASGPSGALEREPWVSELRAEPHATDGIVLSTRPHEDQVTQHALVND